MFCETKTTTMKVKILFVILAVQPFLTFKKLTAGFSPHWVR